MTENQKKALLKTTNEFLIWVGFVLVLFAVFVLVPIEYVSIGMFVVLVVWFFYMLYSVNLSKFEYEDKQIGRAHV